MNAMIVSGGIVEDIFVLGCMEKETYDIMIAVDRGLEFFYRNKLTPDYIVGDFDSVEHRVLSAFQKEKNHAKCPEIIKLNPRKDDTDTEHALHMAMDMGCKCIHLFGTTGSRLDHVLGNLQLLGYGLRNGCECVIWDSHNKIRLINEETVLFKGEQFGSYVSLIPYTPQVTGLTLEGFLYPLNNHTMSNFYMKDAAPISGVSNEISEETARITLKEGILILVESRD